jgi:hypothetical protein
MRRLDHSPAKSSRIAWLWNNPDCVHREQGASALPVCLLQTPADLCLEGDLPQFACACLKFLEISQNLSKWPIPNRHTFKRAKALRIVPLGETPMQFALLIYEPPEAFAARKSDGTDSYTGAWRAYHKALVESGAYVGGDPLEVPETGTTVRLKEGKRRVQDGPFADTKEQLGDS